MQTLAEGDSIVVVLGPGEEVVSSLLEVARAHGIGSGILTGLGSASEVELAFFDPDKREYLPRTFKEQMEIGSLIGNFSHTEEGHHVHVHATVSGPELIAFTGHLHHAVVGTGCEIYVRKLSARLQRVRDPESGFSSLKLP